MTAKRVVLTKAIRARISKYIEQGYMKNEIAHKIGITRQTLYRWEKKDKDLRDMLTEQILLRTETYKEEIVAIADDRSHDLLVDPETGREYPNASAVSRDSLRIKTRQSVMKYDNPEKFGDAAKLDITSKGEGIGAFLGLVITPPAKEEEDES